MKVFCRFAPSNDSAAAIDARNGDALLLRAEGPPLTSSTSVHDASLSSTSSSTGTRVHLADPVTLSKAAFSCDGVFLPPTQTLPEARLRRDCLIRTTLTSVNDKRLEQEQQQQQQELLYRFTCRCVLEDVMAPSATAVRETAPKRVYLAYGQTASGKTYSLFGEAPSSPRGASADARPAAAAGIVPRFLYDAFHPGQNSAHGYHTNNNNNRSSSYISNSSIGAVAASDDGGSDVFVDMSCFEVYNEVTTDLVALSTTLVAASLKDAPRGSGGGAAAAAAARNNSTQNNQCTNGRHTSFRGSAQASTAELQQELAPVLAAHLLHRHEQENTEDDNFAVRYSSGPPIALTVASSPASQEELDSQRSTATAAAATSLLLLKTEYKATEKQQVLRSVERARCTSFSEAQAVLQVLLTLRQECATSRNQNSSRGHLVFRVEVYAPAPDGQGWALRHETAFVDLAGSESGRLAEVDLPFEEPFTHTCRRPRGRSSGPSSANGSLLHSTTSRASSQHSRISQDDSSVHSAGSSSSSRRSNGSSASLAAYHRYLLHPPHEEDRKALRARRLQETRCINASLLALRRVFRALYEATQLTSRASRERPARQDAGALLLPPSSQQQQPQRPPLHHAPFKDTALTAILQPFLLPQPARSCVIDPVSLSASEGKEPVPHVVLLICCSSRSADFYETVASLRLGAEATAVNPEVVLRALPVQRREQQQQQEQQQQVGRPDTLHAQCHTAARCARVAASAPQPLLRSASAPSQRLLLGRPADVAHRASGGDDGEGGDGGSSGRRVGARQLGNDLRRTDTPSGSRAKERVRERETQHGAVSACASTTNDGKASATRGAVEDVARLQAEMRRYRAIAQQLYQQCKSLCESYDECVEEVGKCRRLLADRDARIAELEEHLATVEKAGVPAAIVHLSPPPFIAHRFQPLKNNTSGASDAVDAAVVADSRGQKKRTPPRDGAVLLAEQSSSPPARPPSSASAAERVDVRVKSSSVKAGQATSEGRTLATAARASRMRGVSSSTAREGSARCLVSVSPFSTASLMAGAALDDNATAAAATAASDQKEVEDEEVQQHNVNIEHADVERACVVQGESRSESDSLDSALPVALSSDSRTTKQAVSSSTSDPVITREKEAQPADGNEQKAGKQQQQQQQEQVHQQMQTARSIMNAFLARQIFPSTESGPASSLSPARENSPSPVLPTLSAHNNNNNRSAAMTASTVASACSDIPGKENNEAAAAVPVVLAALPTTALHTLPSNRAGTSSLLKCGKVPTLASSYLGNCSTAQRQMAEQEEDANEKKRAKEVNEVVVTSRGSPAAHTAVASSEGSTRRSKSTVYTILMPPSPSRSQASSRSPSFDASMPDTVDVYQL
ncbi:kinesin [Lotmaria passim]